MKINKTGLCLAITATLGASNVVYAALDTGVRIGGTTSKPVFFAKERNAETAGTITNKVASSLHDLNITFPTQPGYAVNATNTLFVKVTLMKGAKFGGTVNPVLRCYGTNGSTTNTSALGAYQLGGVGSASISFSLPNNFTTTSDAGICTLQASAFVGVPVGGLDVSALVRYKDGVSPLSASKQGTLITFVTGSQFKVGSDKTQVTADVALEGKQFTNSSLVGVTGSLKAGSRKTAYLGFVKYSTVSGVTRYSSSTATYNTSAAIKSASLTIEGASLAAGSTLLLTSAAKGCTSAAIAVFHKSVTLNGTNSITVAGLGTTPAAVKMLSAGLAICLVVDGTKSIDQSTLTASLSATGNSNFTLINSPLGGTNTLATVKQNGTTLRLLNIPNPSNVEKAYVRLYNTGSQPIKVTGSLYTTDGKQVGTTQVLASSLAGFSVQVLDADALKALFADWTGRAMLRLDANSNTFKAVGTIRDATGTLINASGSTKN